MLHLLHALTPRDAVRLACSPQGAGLRYGAHPVDRHLIAVYGAAGVDGGCDTERQNGTKPMTKSGTVRVSTANTSV